VASGAALGLGSEAFAHFAISIVWRASVHRWLLPDGTTTSGLDLGDFAESVRRYLVGTAPLPDSHVTVAVCTDRFSREHWVAPMLSLDHGCHSFPFITLGVVFRVWFGAKTPEHIRRVSCRSKPDHPILVTHCEDQTARILEGLSPLSGTGSANQE
jgi:hypothetical protein